jgi:hypothetical protein
MSDNKQDPAEKCFSRKQLNGFKYSSFANAAKKSECQKNSRHM